MKKRPKTRTTQPSGDSNPVNKDADSAAILEIHGVIDAENPPSVETLSTPQETAAYIADLLQGLQSMSERSKLTYLSDLIEMAKKEADAQRQRCF